MRKPSSICALFFLLFFVFSCENPTEEIVPEINDELSHRYGSTKASKVTGFVNVEWKGKGGKGAVEEKLVFVSFVARESVLYSSNRKVSPARGFFIFSVYKNDFSIERKIVAEVIDVGFSETEDKKAWFSAEIISDTKCGSTDHSGCTDSDHTDEGCSHDDDATHDEGCSHDTDTEHDSGTVHDETEGGCDHDDTETDTGCDHDDTSTEHDEGSGGKPDDKGGKGKQCRLGKYLIAKMHDKGSPGTNDGITWKWFDSLDGFSVDTEPKHLCKKTILGGNLVVHVAKNKSKNH